MNTEKWKKANYRKGIAYRVLQVIMGLAILAFVIALSTLASMPDWSGVQWTTYFLIVGVSAGTGLTAWVAATLLGWADRGQKDGR